LCHTQTDLSGHAKPSNSKRHRQAAARISSKSQYIVFFVHWQRELPVWKFALFGLKIGLSGLPESERRIDLPQSWGLTCH
jgi:hypothetical protein